MTDCYICGRKSTTNCTKCYQSICHIHVEDEKTLNERITGICSSCKRKQKLNRIRIIIVVVCIILMTLAIFGAVFTATNIFGS